MQNIIKQPLYKILYVQVIVAILFGIALGHFFPDIGESLNHSVMLSLKLLR